MYTLEIRFKDTKFSHCVMSILTNFRQAPKKQKTVCSKRIEAFTVRGFIYVTSKVMLACGQLKEESLFS